MLSLHLGRKTNKSPLTSRCCCWLMCSHTLLAACALATRGKHQPQDAPLPQGSLWPIATSIMVHKKWDTQTWPHNLLIHTNELSEFCTFFHTCHNFYNNMWDHQVGEMQNLQFMFLWLLKWLCWGLSASYFVLEYCPESCKHKNTWIISWSGHSIIA